ncbi:MAG: tRNA pseudouridine(54/55) synthase Pus10 [Candidatus Thorarchaeota archaeon]
MSDGYQKDILTTAAEILKKYPVCDRCLGRQFAWLSTDTSNVERGRSIKLLLSMVADNEIKSGSTDNGKELLNSLAGHGMFLPAQKRAEENSVDYKQSNSCHLCTIDDSFVFDRIPNLVEDVLQKAKDIEFETFLVGTVPIPMLAEHQDEIRGAHDLLHGETLKSDFNRELGKKLADALQKQVDFGRPDVVIVYDMTADSVRIQINPLFIYGRYLKKKRGIPQSRWDCGDCNGKGCDTCGGTGRKYQDSVSEYVGIPIMKYVQGSRFKFHAAGREDIDVLMLGSGRPFVVEISEPRIRKPVLRELAKRINKEAKKKIEVRDLEISARSHAQTLKNEASDNIKEYVAIIKPDSDVPETDLRRIESDLSGAYLDQRTPNRVSHRRSDLIRKKQIHEVRIEKKSDGLLEGFFKVQGGTYVKELISGDDGRTTPSLSESLGVKCECIQLDVIAIYTNETDHNA